MLEVLPSLTDNFEQLTLSMASPNLTGNYNNQHQENSDNSSNSSSNNDYTDRRSLPITIPSYEFIEFDKNEKFAVFNIYMAGRHLCSRFVRFDRQHNNITIHQNSNKHLPYFKALQRVHCFKSTTEKRIY